MVDAYFINKHSLKKLYSQCRSQNKENEWINEFAQALNLILTISKLSQVFLRTQILITDTITIIPTIGIIMIGKPDPSNSDAILKVFQVWIKVIRLWFCTSQNVIQRSLPHTCYLSATKTYSRNGFSAKQKLLNFSFFFIIIAIVFLSAV